MFCFRIPKDASSCFHRHLTFLLLFVLALGTVWRFASHASPQVINVRSADRVDIRAAVWAVHFGYDNFGRNSFDRIVSRLRESRANIVGLVETDLARIFNGNWDLVDYLQHRMGWFADYGPGTLNNTWGCSLLSRFPIIEVHRVNLPSPQGEVACLIEATVEVSSQRVKVVVSHFGNSPHHLDRLLQAADSLERGARFNLAASHALWLGYLTDRPGSISHQMMLSAGWVDSTNALDRWCLYIFSQRLSQISFERLPQLDDSDTEIQVASYVLPLK